VKHDAIVNRFEAYLRRNKLKLTAQRRKVLDTVFEIHEHFTADQLAAWLSEAGAGVSRATVYRTLDLLDKGGFVQSLGTGEGGLLYEHVLGHRHHDHMVCLRCGEIEEFQDQIIEELQAAAAHRKGFHLTGHLLRLTGVCRTCAAELKREGRLEEVLRDYGPGSVLDQ